VNLTEWAHAQGIHVTTAYRWYREGTMPVPAQKVGRLILVSPGTAVGSSPRGRAGLYARVSLPDHKADLDRQVARLPTRALRLLAGPAATVVGWSTATGWEG
jgi:putative resolvase